jgi:hypothetical protein
MSLDKIVITVAYAAGTVSVACLAPVSQHVSQQLNLPMIRVCPTPMSSCSALSYSKGQPLDTEVIYSEHRWIFVLVRLQHLN